MDHDPRISVWAEPPAMDGGAPMPALFCSENTLWCAYYLRPTKTQPSDRTAVLCFKTVLHYRFGFPNEDALPRHPLHKIGVRPYGFYVVENSPLLAELDGVQDAESPNSLPIRHWIVAFHDETLEVMARSASLIREMTAPPDEAVRIASKLLLESPS